MLDLAFVREHLPLVEEKLRARGAKPEEVLGDFRTIDQRRRAAVLSLETALARRNELSKKIGPLMGAEKKGAITAAQKADLETLTAEVAKLKEQTPALEKQRDQADAELKAILTTIPNLPHESVPVGHDETANKEVKRWGEPPEFDFTAQAALGARRELCAFSTSKRRENHRRALRRLLGPGARLERALMNFMLDLHTREHGYTEVLPPYMVNSESMYGTGQLPKFEADLFKVPHGERDLWLIPTAEVPVTNIYRDETLDGARLPISLAAYTPCFRSEAGSLRQGRARHHSPAPVPEGRAGEVHPAGAVLRGAREADPQRRAGAGDASACTIAACCSALETWAFQLGQDLRPRGLAAGPGTVPRDLFLLELRELPGATGEHPLSAGREEGQRAGAHAERQRAGHRTHLGGHRGELPAGRRQRADPGGAAVLRGCGAHHASAALIATRLRYTVKEAVGIWKTIRGYIWWTWDRGTLHYDIMVTLILAFIFISPYFINYKDKPVSRGLRPREVLVMPDTAEGFSYRVEASAVQGKSEVEIRKSLSAILAQVAGADAQLDHYEVVKEPNGRVSAYKAFVRRGK